jgi:antitoxin component HigA of HigAB toxin-antitoxin module
MKISEAKLRQIIKEELAATLEEDYEDDRYDDTYPDAIQLGRKVAKYYIKQRNQVQPHHAHRYDDAFDSAIKKFK